MMGGDLPTLDDFSLQLITDEEMIACNQNGVMGHLVFKKDGIEIWNTPKKNSKNGWIGIFNRTPKVNEVSVKTEDLGLDANKTYELENIWENREVSGLDFSVNPNGVVFLRYINN